MADDRTIVVQTGGNQALGWIITLLAAGAVSVGGYVVWKLLQPQETFTILNPILTPPDVVSGSVTKIIIPVKNNGTQDMKVILHAEVDEMNSTLIDVLLWPWGSATGSVVDTKDFQVTNLPAGKITNFEWDWTASGLQTGKWITVAISDESGVLVPKVGPNNPNVFKQEFEVLAPGSSKAISFEMMNPTETVINPVVGNSTVITVPVQNKGVTTQTITVLLDIREHGLTGPGNDVESKTFGPFTLAQNNTENVQWTWVAKGAVGSKDLVASVLINGQLAPNTYGQGDIIEDNNPKTFTNFMSVAQSLAPAGHIVLPVSVNYGNDYWNHAIPVVITDPGKTLQFLFAIHNDSAGSLNMGVTLVITGPDNITLRQAAQIVPANNGANIALTTPVLKSLDGLYNISIRLWNNSDTDANILDGYVYNGAFIVSSFAFTVQLLPPIPPNATEWRASWFNNSYDNNNIAWQTPTKIPVTQAIQVTGISPTGGLYVNFYDADGNWVGSAQSVIQTVSDGCVYYIDGLGNLNYIYDYPYQQEAYHTLSADKLIYNTIPEFLIRR